jgi:hypothetical protein
MKKFFLTLTVLMCVTLQGADVSKKHTNGKPRNMHSKKACSKFIVSIKKSTKNALELQYAKFSPDQAATFRKWDKLYIFGASLVAASKRNNKGQNE